ncbi:MAG TPA: lysophospholipid acyltransferase family protein [Gaiellaceae bacterium]|jgi:1-acyl-sn-glycerol-3-phosphate acyltransferase
MTHKDVSWVLGRATLGNLAGVMSRVRVYGRDRVPREGGLVVALNHFSWIDIPLFAIANPRNTSFVAKAEAHRIPGLGQFIREFDSFAIRRGESDREAVRRMREVVRDGGCLGVFVEGTRQRSGVPGVVQPGAAMVAVKEQVPIVCGAIHGSQTWKLGNFHRVTIAWGEPWTVGELTRDEVSARIKDEIETLWRWLVEMHEQGRRPLRATPPPSSARSRSSASPTSASPPSSTA